MARSKGDKHTSTWSKWKASAKNSSETDTILPPKAALDNSVSMIGQIEFHYLKQESGENSTSTDGRSKMFREVL